MDVRIVQERRLGRAPHTHEALPMHDAPHKMSDPPHAKVFIEGRYRKLSRDLPQTVFFCPECKGHPRRRKGCARCEGFGKLTRDSVQELIGWVVGAAFKTRKNKFHGAGREDVDVRMLGEGRPFVMEMVNPKVLDVDLAAVEDEVNRRNAGRLEVRGLHWTEKSRVRAIKETPHAKEYTARVRIDGSVAPDVLAKLVGTRIKVTQQTPQRVKHRRADKARERWIEFREFVRAPDRPAAAVDAGATASLAPPSAPMSATMNATTDASTEAATDASNWLVRIRTEHGTYVKEVINGESGSTTPSLSELVGHPCHCVELDVSAILDVEGQAEEVRPVPARFGDNV
jgi:tRNA pseudouridine synthase 10